LGDLQSCGSSGGCSCNYEPSFNGDSTCTDINDACFGMSSCCPSGGTGGTPQSNYFLVTATPGTQTLNANTGYSYTVYVQSNDSSQNGTISLTASGGPDAGTFNCGSYGPAPYYTHYTYTGTNPQTPASSNTTCQFTGNTGNIGTNYSITFTGVYLRNGVQTSTYNVALIVNPPPPTQTLTPCVRNVCTNVADTDYFYYVEKGQMVSTYCLAQYNNCSSPDYVINGTNYWLRMGGQDTSRCLNLQSPVPACTMSGTLTPASASCVIAKDASSCNINFSWTTTNPVATSSVTSSYPSANTIVANGNSGGPTAFSIPWGGRTFYLYNNAVQLATSAVDASSVTCVSGTAWNGTKCAANTICQDSTANNVGGPLPCTYGSTSGANISADKTTVAPGDPVVITWAGQSGATSCVGTHFTIPGNASSGSVTVNPTYTTTYTVTCNGQSASVKVTVRIKPKIIEN
jgi:hypothetical protein